MPRIRTVKPEFFRHEALYDLEVSLGIPVRLAFQGLWTIADREGRFKWRPRAIKPDVLPYDECDFGALLDALAEHGFLVKYEVGGEWFGWIPTFLDHQNINAKEAQSKLPPPPDIERHTPTSESTEISIGKGKEGKGTGKEGKESGRAKGASHTSASTLPDNFPGEKEFEYPRSRGWSESAIQDDAAAFRRYWLSPDAKNGGRKKDWSLAWQTWVRNSRNDRRANAPPKQSQSEKDDAAFREAARRIEASQ